jgi:hypothetical protein
MIEDIVFSQLWVEENDPSFAGVFTGGKDDLVVGLEVAAAIRAEKVVFFHG